MLHLAMLPKKSRLQSVSRKKVPSTGSADEDRYASRSMPCAYLELAKIVAG